MASDDADYAMDGDEAMIQCLGIGIGCSSRATVEDIKHLILSCVFELPLGSILATLDRRAVIGEIVAGDLGLELMLFSSSSLASAAGTTIHSARTLREVGISSVAEASALTCLGPKARLIVPRQTGHLCTCAVAVLP